MVCMSTSSTLFGMVQHHVTALGALLVCGLLLTSAQSAPQVDPLKLLDADEAQVQHTEPSSSLLQHRHSASPAQPSSPSNNNNNNNNNNNLSHKNVDPDVLEKPTTSDGSHVKSSSDTEPETDVQSSPDKPIAPPFDYQQWKRVYGGEIPADAFTKRFLQGFVGSRGKRAVDEGAVPVNPTMLDQWQAMYDGGDLPPEDALSKRFSQAFVGSRGRRGGMEGDEEVFPLLYDQRKRATGRQFKSGATGAGDSHVVMRRWFNPASFTASRGKRYMPGLEALLLSQMYKKLDAEKWKRQSMLGFHAARG